MFRLLTCFLVLVTTRYAVGFESNRLVSTNNAMNGGDDARFESREAAIQQLSTLGAPVTPPFPCTFTAPDGTYFDFSGLTTATGTTVRGTQSDVYNINVCGIAEGDGASGVCVQNSASVCFQFTWSPDWFALAEYTNTPTTNPPTFSLITPGSVADGVQLVFNNGQYGPNQAKLIMLFECITTGQTTYQAQHDSSYQWTVTVQSTLACSQPAPSGGGGGGSGSGHLSNGWIFIIIILVCSVVYVASGCAYKHYRVGTQGIESCPNIDFWRELPGLVKDGCIYFVLKCKEGIAKCQGKSGGGGGSGSDYNDFK